MIGWLMMLLLLASVVSGSLFNAFEVADIKRRNGGSLNFVVNLTPDSPTFPKEFARWTVYDVAHSNQHESQLLQGISAAMRSFYAGAPERDSPHWQEHALSYLLSHQTRLPIDDMTLLTAGTTGVVSVRFADGSRLAFRMDGGHVRYPEYIQGSARDKNGNPIAWGKVSPGAAMESMLIGRHAFADPVALSQWWEQASMHGVRLTGAANISEVSGSAALACDRAAPRRITCQLLDTST